MMLQTVEFPKLTPDITQQYFGSKESSTNSNRLGQSFIWMH